MEDYDYDYEEGPYCRVCDGLGHSAGEFGDYCPSGKPAGWFDPVYDFDEDEPGPGSFAYVAPTDDQPSAEVWW